MTTAPSLGPQTADQDLNRPEWLELGRREPTRRLRFFAAIGAHPHPVISLLLAIYVAVIIPMQRSEPYLLGNPRMVGAVTSLALIAMVAVPRPWWLVRAGAPLLAAAIIYQQGEGEMLAAWVLLALVSVAWAAADRPPIPLPKPPAPGADLVVGFLSIGAVAVFPYEWTWQPLTVLAIGPALLLVTAGTQPPAGRWLDRAGGAVERAVGYVVAAIVALVVVVARLIRRAFFRNDRTEGWARVDDQLADPRRARRPRPKRLRRGWLPAAATVVLAFLAVSLWRFAFDRVTDSVAFPSDKGVSAQKLGVVQPDEPIPAAYTDEDWYPGFREDMAWVTDERVAWRPLTVQRVLDVETPTVNVHDRVRDSWTAPKCQCRRVTVWLYGGSGAFGLGQRDDHTIASELARLAADDGVVLDVQNRGIPGQMHWRNSTRFAWDLAAEPKPDLVVFYEGAEEVDSEVELRSRGLADTRAPFEAFSTDLYDEAVGAPEGTPDTPDEVTYRGWPELDDEPGPPGQLAAARYDRSLTMSNRTAEANEVPVRYFWQPSRYGGTDGPKIAKDDLRGKVFRGAPPMLSDDVVDLSGVLDDEKGNLFSDDTNHNEVAARLIAAAMWEELRPQASDLAGS